MDSRLPEGFTYTAYPEKKDDYWAHVQGQGGGREGKGRAWEGIKAGGDVRPGKEVGQASKKGEHALWPN